MLDKVLATLSLASLVAFMGIVLVFINEPDLWIVVAVVLVMAGFDFFTTLKGQKDDEKASE